MRRASLVTWTLVATLAAWAGCHCGAEEKPLPPPPKAKAPIRGAAADAELRLMLAEVASAKACDLIEGQFRPLRAPDRPSVATGILWMRDCRITHDGTDIVFHFRGNGWQWADQEKKKAGGTFALQQQVRFAVDVEVPGALDFAYDRHTHVFSLWFTPSRAPSTKFTPLGDLDVEPQSAWASTIGALGSIFGASPEELAEKDAKKQGTHQFELQLADGLAATIDLCTGLTRFNLGRPAKGRMQPADVGEAFAVPYELHDGGLMVLGPYLAPKGMTAHLDVEPGALVRASIMCHADAEKVAAAFVDGAPPPDVKLLAAKDVAGEATIHARATACPVAIVARAIANGDPKPARFTWKRPPAESARATGGPLIRCPHPSTTQTAAAP